LTLRWHSAGIAPFDPAAGGTVGVAFRLLITADMKKYPQLHLDNQVCFSVYSLHRRITQSYQSLLKPLGLTYPQYLVMLVLWQAAEEAQLPVTVTFLCQRLMLDTGTVTPLLKRMEQAGLVDRRRADRDERVVLVALTAKGLALREPASTVPLALACNRGVDVNEALGLRDTIKRWLQRWVG
jgi:DNA-binding MarR family transcriptional regulator